MFPSQGRTSDHGDTHCLLVERYCRKRGVYVRYNFGTKCVGHVLRRIFYDFVVVKITLYQLDHELFKYKYRVSDRWKVVLDPLRKDH